MTPLPAARVLDMFFLDARSRLLDLAATLDRLDRGDGSARRRPAARAHPPGPARPCSRPGPGGPSGCSRSSRWTTTPTGRGRSRASLDPPSPPLHADPRYLPRVPVPLPRGRRVRRPARPVPGMHGRPPGARPGRPGPPGRTARAVPVHAAPRAEAFEPVPIPPPMPGGGNGRRDDEPGEGPAPTSTTARPPRFDPRERAERWARVHRGLGYLQVAVVLGFVSQILQTTPDDRPRGRAGEPERDAGQRADRPRVRGVADDAGGRDVLGPRPGGRAAGAVRAGPQAAPGPASSWSWRASPAVLVDFCLFVAAIGAIAQAGANGARRRPRPCCSYCARSWAPSRLTAGLVAGAEVAGLMALGRIGDALRDRAAAGWARRSIVVMFIAGGLIMFGPVRALVYAGEQQKQREKERAGPGRSARPTARTRRRTRRRENGKGPGGGQGQGKAETARTPTRTSRRPPGPGTRRRSRWTGRWR